MSVEPAAVADTAAVRVAFDSLVSRIRRLDVQATLQSYDTSAAFAQVLDGDFIRGRAAYDGWLTRAFGTLKSIDDIAIDSVHYVPVNKDAILMLAAYRETLVDASGARVRERGMWSNLFVRRPDGWKVLYGHSSHVPLPAQ